MHSLRAGVGGWTRDNVLEAGGPAYDNLGAKSAFRCLQ